ncbi:MAG: hypothetical protein FWD17_14960, partial [Polyangiaceae bacterium]|nr:hypothetical protein [Polyangiaceae bacterium]
GNSTPDTIASNPSGISIAEGSFPVVTGVTDEQSNGVSNAYTLQMNTNYFHPALCNGAADPSRCMGWQQFIYQSNGIGFIQYWLLNYGNTCPSGWMGTPLAPGDCFRNSDSAISVPSLPIANLSEITVIGAADSVYDYLYIVIAGTVYNFNPPTVLEPTPSPDGGPNQWVTTEFNVFGDGNGYQATFSGSESTIAVKLFVFNGHNADDLVNPVPACATGKFTAETNSLTIVPNSCCTFGGSPAGLQFTESNSPSATAVPCPQPSPGNPIAVGATRAAWFWPRPAFF